LGIIAAPDRPYEGWAGKPYLLTTGVMQAEAVLTQSSKGTVHGVSVGLNDAGQGPECGAQNIEPESGPPFIGPREILLGEDAEEIEWVTHRGRQ
jgi:hypothetical protein